MHAMQSVLPTSQKRYWVLDLSLEKYYYIIIMVYGKSFLEGVLHDKQV